MLNSREHFALVVGILILVLIAIRSICHFYDVCLWLFS